jgi:hypothetical protein
VIIFCRLPKPIPIEKRLLDIDGNVGKGDKWGGCEGCGEEMGELIHKHFKGYMFHLGGWPVHARARGW